MATQFQSASDGFNDDLLKFAENRINGLGFSITDTARNTLKDFIKIGVSRMTADDLQSPSKKLLAENNLIKLIDEAVRVSRVNLNESIQTKTFSDTRMKICPLWPFC